MKICFKKIIIDNFLSFGHAELDLENKGYTLIEGINHNPNDSAESNGSGKSTIFSALCFALTGETIQGLSSNLRNMYVPESNMSVELHFTFDKDYFEITRTRSNKEHGDLKISVNGVDKSGKGLRESQAVLNQYLPSLKSDLIGEVIIVGQGMPHKFSNNTPSGRKDLLEKLSNSDLMLADIRARVDNRNDKIKNQKLSTDNKLIELGTKCSMTENLISTKKLELQKYNVRPDFEKEIEDLNTLITQLNDTQNKDNLTLTSLRTNMDKNEADLKDVCNEENKVKADELKAFNAANLDIKTAIVQLKSDIKSLEKEIKEKESIKDICPLCGQKIPHVNKPDVSPLKEEKEKIQLKYQEYMNKDTQQQQAFRLNEVDIENQFSEKKLKLEKLIRDLKEDVRNIETKSRQTSSNLNNAKMKLNNVKRSKNFFEENIQKCATELVNLESKLKQLNEEKLYNIREQESIQNHLDVVSKLKTYVKRDFRGILLSNVIKYIDTKAKEYSKEIFGTRELSFQLEGNNINISYLNKPLEALSGGEQQKVDLIMQFAIRSMMQEYTGFSSNILVLDEILDNLDSLGCDRVLEFITNKLSDIESIFIISHHAGTLNIGNDSTITVTKDIKGVSSLYEK